MSEFIDRAEVMRRVREFIGNPTYNELMLVNDLSCLPFTEMEQKTGKWIENYVYSYHDIRIWECRCSLCGHAIAITCCKSRDKYSPDPRYEYCPHCGARMEMR